jgi:nucleotide-binding universal stress UspA family protein
MSVESSQVVVGFDFSKSAHAALDRAIGVAARAPWHVLHFVCVLDKHSAIPAVPTKRVDFEYTDRVHDEVARLVERELHAQLIDDRVKYFVHVRIGKPAREILDLAEDIGADLIIVGCKGVTGIERWMVGSTAEKVAREARCTVEVTRPKTYATVPLLEITDVEPHAHPYEGPHRYHYDDRRVLRRPDDWPLY